MRFILMESMKTIEKTGSSWNLVAQAEAMPGFGTMDSGCEQLRLAYAPSVAQAGLTDAVCNPLAGSVFCRKPSVR